MGQGETIIAMAVAVAIIMIGLAVVEYVHGAGSIALTDGKNTLYANRSQAAWR